MVEMTQWGAFFGGRVRRASIDATIRFAIPCPTVVGGLNGLRPELHCHASHPHAAKWSAENKKVSSVVKVNGSVHFHFCYNSSHT